MNEPIFKHKTTWWRSGIKMEQRGKRIEDVVITPVEPFIKYDPFSFYYPNEISTRTKRSLPYLFLDVDAKKLEDVESFCKQFGVLGDDGTFFQWEIETSLVTFKVGGKNISYAELVRSNTTNYKQRKYLTEELLGLEAGKRPDPSLCVPMSLKDFQIAQDQLRKTIKFINQIRDPKLLTIEKRVAQNYLNWVFSVRFGFAKPGLSWNEQDNRFVTGWDVGSLSAAMYLMLLFDIQGKGKVLTCPRCNKVFLGERPKTAYCSSRCQNQAKVARCRENKRKKNQKKNNKEVSHGKTKRKG